MITLEAAALHSVIQRTFSGNSSEAEIHLIFLVSAFLFLGRRYLFCKGKKKRKEKKT